MHQLALVYVEQERRAKSEPPLLRAFEGYEVELGPEHRCTVESLKQLVRLYESCDKPNEATERGAKLPRLEAAEQQN